MAFKVFTKDSLPKYPVKTFFRKLLPSPQKLAFACAEKEGYFTKYPKASESIKELMQGPMYAWVPSLIGGGSKQLDKLNRAEREFNWKQEAEKRKAEALTKKAFNDYIKNHPEEVERRRKQYIVNDDRQFALENAEDYKKLDKKAIKNGKSPYSSRHRKEVVLYCSYTDECGNNVLAFDFDRKSDAEKISPTERILKNRAPKWVRELQEKISYTESLLKCTIMDGKTLKPSLASENSINYVYIKNKEGKLKLEKLSDVVAKIDGIIDDVFRLEYVVEPKAFPLDYICKITDIYSNLPDALKTDAGWKKIIDGISKDPNLTLEFGSYANWSYTLVNIKNICKYFFPPIIPLKHTRYAKQKLDEAKVSVKIEGMLNDAFKSKNLLPISSSMKFEVIDTYIFLPNALKSDTSWKIIIENLSEGIKTEHEIDKLKKIRNYFSLFLLSAIPTKHIEYAKQKLEDAFAQALKNRELDFRFYPSKKVEFIDFFMQFPPQFQSQSTWHKMIDYFVEEMGKEHKAFDSFKYMKKVPTEHRNYLWKAFIRQIIQNPFEHYAFDAIADLNNLPKKYENYALSQLNIYWSGYISSTIFERIITLNEPYKTHILKNTLKSPDCYLKTRIAAYEFLEGKKATFNEKIWIYHIQRLAKKGKTEKLENELKGSNLS